MCTALLLINRGAGPLVFSVNRGDDRIDPGLQTTCVVSRFEMWLDLIFSDLFAGRIGQRAFQAVADLNKHLAVLYEDKENDAIVFALLPHAPGPSHTNRVIVDGRLRLHLWINGHDHLVAG